MRPLSVVCCHSLNSSADKVLLVNTLGPVAPLYVLPSVRRSSARGLVGFLQILFRVPDAFLSLPRGTAASGSFRVPLEFHNFPFLRVPSGVSLEFI